MYTHLSTENDKFQSTRSFSHAVSNILTPAGVLGIAQWLLGFVVSSVAMLTLQGQLEIGGLLVLADSR